VPFLSYAVAVIGYHLLRDQGHSLMALTVAVMALSYSAGARLRVFTCLVSRYAGLRAFGAVFVGLGPYPSFPVPPMRESKAALVPKAAS
jgi:hypothetical protein